MPHATSQSRISVPVALKGGETRNTSDKANKQTLMFNAFFILVAKMFGKIKICNFLSIIYRVSACIFWTNSLKPRD